MGQLLLPDSRKNHFSLSSLVSSTVLGIAVSFGTPLSAQTPESASEPKPGTVLRTLSAGLAIPGTELRKLYLVDLEATVTFKFGHLFYLHDGTSGIFAQAYGISSEELTGKRLRVQGSLFKGDYVNQLMLSGYEILGAGRLPVGELRTFDQLEEGIFDSQWVAIEGVVDEVEATEDQLWANLVMEGGRCDLKLVPVLSSGDLASVKRGTVLQVEGVSAIRTGDAKSVASLHIYAPGFDQLKILNAQTDTLFQESLTPAGKLSLNLGNQITDRVNVKGTYIGSLPDHSIVIQDGDSSVVVRSHQQEGLAMGDTIIANGRASTSDSHPSLLEAAIIDKTGEGKLSPPLLSRNQLSEPLVHDRLVRIQGLYKGRIAMVRDVQFRVEVDGSEVLAHLPGREIELPNEIRSLSFNSEIELTGICQNLTDPDGLPSLILENSESIKVIASGRSYHYKTVLFAILGFVFLAGGAAGWFLLIRSRFLLTPAAAPATKTRDEDVDAPLHQILENAHDFIFTCDPSGNFISINSAGGSVLGYEESEWKAMNWKQLVDPDQPNQLQEIRWLTESEKPIEVVLKKRSGAPICFEVNARFLTQKGKPHAIHAIARDITERVRYEKELIKAKQSAEEATQAKSEFLAGISREIRTSVNGIIGMTDLVLSSALPTEEKRFTSIAHQSAKNLLVILNDLLDYPRDEVGKLELANDEFSLRKELDQAMSAMGISAQEKNLELRHDLL